VEHCERGPKNAVNYSRHEQGAGLVVLGGEEVDFEEAAVLGEKCCTAKLAPKWLVEHGTISLEEWLEDHGPITRPGRCIPCEGWEPEEPEDKGKVRFWVGDWTVQHEDEHINRTHLIQRVQQAVKVLRAKGYDAKFVGGSKGSLLEAATEQGLVALWAGAHGFCDYLSWPGRRDYLKCEMAATFNKARIFAIEPLSGLDSDWPPSMDSDVLRRLYVYHCIYELTDKDIGAVRQLYSAVTGVPTWKLRTCAVDKFGYCHFTQYAESISELAMVLP